MFCPLRAKGESEMGKEIVTHSCGHTVTHDLYGKHADRDRKVAWLETVPCQECSARAAAGPNAEEVEMSYREYKTKYADCKTLPGSYDANAKTIVVFVPKKAVEEPQDNSDEAAELPALQGTEDQVKRATVIRSNFLADLKKITAHWGEHIVIARTKLGIGPVLDFYGKPVDSADFADRCNKMVSADPELAEEVEEVTERITRYLGVKNAQWWINHSRYECGQMCVFEVKTP